MKAGGMVSLVIIFYFSYRLLSAQFYLTKEYYKNSNIANHIKEFDMKLSSTLLPVFLLSSLIFAQTAGTELLQLGKIQNGVKTKRVSSYDRSGSSQL